MGAYVQISIGGKMFTKTIGKFAIFLGLMILSATIGIGTASAQSSSPDLTGQWVSKGCETGGNNQFFTRDFRFNQANWSLTFVNYADSACTQSTLTFYVEGTYTVGGASASVPDGLEADFVFQEAKLTPHNQATADFLNSAEANTCGAETWQPDLQQSVAATDGCSVIGLSLPLTEYDLIKVENDELYFGARPTDGSFLDSLDKRPTSFAPPLVRAAAAPAPATQPAAAAPAPATQPTALPQTGGDLPNVGGLLVGLAILLILAGGALRRFRTLI
jgi:LPXTG-motif cell wall-anchored protein